VPTYQYVCTECGEPLEAVQSFTDDALTTCPACGGQLRKVFSAVGVVFKGSGFYRNDSRTPAGSKSASSSNGEGSGSESSGSDAKTDSTKKDSAKSESAPSDKKPSDAKPAANGSAPTATPAAKPSGSGSAA
jgi:putative FmdB family regulatory protein